MASTQTLPAALILAGTRPGGDPFALQQGVAHKALIKIADKTLLERVIGALRDAGIERIAVSCEAGPVADLARTLGAEVIAPMPGPSASVGKAFAEIGAPLLVTTSDHGLLEAGWVTEFIDGTPEDADLSIMMAKRRVVEAAVPDTRRTYLRFADGHWSGCNLFFLQRPEAYRALETWSMVEAHRKRPWRIAARLGLGTLLSMAFGRLTLAEGLSRLGQRIGVKAALVAASDGRAAVDIDKPADLELARRLIGAGISRASTEHFSR